jgi:long-subunit fatty acid transport protein
MSKSAILVFTLVLCCTASTAQATNAMNMISYDARSAGMGGADTALGLSSMAIASNPAGITQFPVRIDANLSLLVPMLTASDRAVGSQTMELNKELNSETNVFPMFGVGVSSRIWRNLYGAIGVFVQGGMGADFRNLRGFKDDDPGAPLSVSPQEHFYDTHSQVMYIKVAPTLAYRAGPVSIGASMHMGAARMEWNHGGMQFPEQDNDRIYVPHTVDYASDWAFAAAGRFGVLVQLLQDRLRFGTSFMMQARPSFSGTLTLDNQLEYEASTDDFGWARELNVGVAGYLFKRRLLVAADVRWAHWSNVVDKVSFAATARDPSRTPPQMARLELPFQMSWRDAVILATGAEFAAIRDLVFVRVGYNWGRPVVTGEGINPLFPPVSEHHLTFGLGLDNIWGGLGVNLAVEYAFPSEVGSSNDNQMAFEPGSGNPNGYQVEVAMQQFTTHLMVNYQF